MNLFERTNTVEGTPGWTKNEKRYALYNFTQAQFDALSPTLKVIAFVTANLSCDQFKAVFNALTLTQMIARTSPVKPDTTTGGPWEVRDCTSTAPTTNPTIPTTPPVTTPGNPTSDLEDELVFTGQNMSDSPSNNPTVMSVTPTFIGNGQFTVKVAGSDLANLWIVYNTMGYQSVAAIEARTYRCGVPHLFLGYIMPGTPDDSRRSDGTLNAHQILSVF